MKNYYFFNLIKKTTIQFLDVFNDIQIAKYNSDGTISKYIDVPIKLSSKQKFYYWVNDKTNEKRLPMMSCNLTEITPAINERGTNTKIHIPIDDDVYHENLIPYNFGFEVYIATNYINEIEQILEQILPFFIPYVYISINLTEIKNSFDIKTILNGVSQDKTVEMSDTDYRAIIYTLSFELKGYLLKPITDHKIIEQIYLNIYNDQTGLFENDSYPSETFFMSGHENENNEIIYDYKILEDI